MELPVPLRRAVDAALEGVALADLAAAADALSKRYRAELQDGRLHLAHERAVLAYLATRMPATYAAVRSSLDAAAIARPDFAPVTMLDVGAGPGTALWASAGCWPSLNEALLVEASEKVRSFGERLAASASPARITWRVANACDGLSDCTPRDLVTLAYVLGELAATQRSALVERLWQLTGDVLVIVEPGTPAGWQRVLAARAALLEAGAHLIAPCPHAALCPLAAPDWCHFAARVARSRLHRMAKGADVPWEDEKFIYLAASRKTAPPPGARVIAPPRSASGRVTLKLCRRDGTAGGRLISRRDGDAYKAARRTDWGDPFEF